MKKQTDAQEYFTIGTFNIKKKVVYIVVALFVIIFAYSKFKSYLDEKEKQARLAAINNDYTTVSVEQMSMHDRIQARLREQYGIPPEGFEWDYLGNLIPLSVDDLSYEEITYMYIRALSVLDFFTAQKVARKSYVVDLYEQYYDTVTSVTGDYSTSFYRKQLRKSLESLVVKGIEDVAVMADGSVICTVNVTCLDLTNKSFWLNDRDELFEHMYYFEQSELDREKKEEYLYNYLEEKYEDKTNPIGLKDHTIDIVISKDNSGGWLVTDDVELRKILTYEDGVDIAAYIVDVYNDWAREKKLHNDDAPDYSDGNLTVTVTDTVDVVAPDTTPHNAKTDDSESNTNTTNDANTSDFDSNTTSNSIEDTQNDTNYPVGTIYVDDQGNIITVTDENTGTTAPVQPTGTPVTTSNGSVADGVKEEDNSQKVDTESVSVVVNQ